jgi:hypothetical protein
MRRSLPLGVALLLVLFGAGTVGVLLMAPLAVEKRAQPSKRPQPSPTATATPSPSATPSPTPTPVPEPVSCISPKEKPYYYAGLRGKEHGWSFGPTAEPWGPRTLAGLKRELTERLCGTATHGGDQRLFVTLRAVVFGYHDPNFRISHEEWERGVPELLSMFDWGYGTHVKSHQSGVRPTMSMEPHGGTAHNPTVHAAESHMDNDRVLKLAVNGPNGVFNMIDLRLKCGFQPLFDSRRSLPAAL